MTAFLSETPTQTNAALTGERPIAGLVPHAGWAFSGGVAARVLNQLATTRTPDVIILFGSVHRQRGKQGALFGSGRWETPLGALEIDSRLAERILSQTNLIVDDPYAHADEHSLEVQMPMIRHLFPNAKIVPIAVPAVPQAHEMGQAVGRTLTAYQYDALIVGTTDLTHYGPRYGFADHGIGVVGTRWAKEDNDRRFIDLTCEMKAEDLVRESMEHRNACGGGATAATVAAAAHAGATRGELLEHTTSSEVLAGQIPGEQEDSVGYAGIVFV